MRIAFTGAQGTGKTTLISKLKYTLPNYVIYDEVVRKLVKRTGISINREADDYSQIAITNEQVRLASESYFKKENALFDRCIIDSHSFTEHDYKDGLVSKKTYNYSQQMFLMVFKYFPYDLVIYIPPKIELIEVGVRDTEVAYRDAIDKIMKRQILRRGVISHNLKSVSLENRIEEIKLLLMEL